MKIPIDEQKQFSDYDLKTYINNSRQSCRLFSFFGLENNLQLTSLQICESRQLLAGPGPPVKVCLVLELQVGRLLALAQRYL